MAADVRTLKFGEIIELYGAHQLLDGKNRVVKAEKAEGVIQEPYEFDPKKKVRYAVARNLRILREYVEDYNTALLKSLTDRVKAAGIEKAVDGMTVAQIGADTQLAPLFQQAQRDEQANTEEVAGLFMLDYDGLRVEENGIPGTTISVLLPLLTAPAADAASTKS